MGKILFAMLAAMLVGCGEFEADTPGEKSVSLEFVERGSWMYGGVFKLTDAGSADLKAFVASLKSRDETTFRPLGGEIAFDWGNATQSNWRDLFPGGDLTVLLENPDASWSTFGTARLLPGQTPLGITPSPILRTIEPARPMLLSGTPEVNVVLSDGFYPIDRDRPKLTLMLTIGAIPY